MKKLTKDNFMKLFIIFAIPVIYSMIYDFLMRITTYKSWVGIGLSLIFLIIWYFAGRYIGKQKIDYKTAVYGIHGLLIIGSVLSLIAVLMYPQAPTFFRDDNGLYKSIYLVTRGHHNASYNNVNILF